jgi:hypothetical protein
MIRYIFIALLLLSGAMPVLGQELYVNTEPASNMATRSLGIRLENQGLTETTLKTAPAWS